MAANLSVPLVGPFDPLTSKPNFNVNADDENVRPGGLKTWDPAQEESKMDVKLAHIHPAELDGGEYGHTQAGSRPDVLEDLGGYLDSDALASGGQLGGRCRYRY